MVKNTTATETEQTEIPQADTRPLKIETDSEYPWAVVIVDGSLRINPGVPAFQTKEQAQEYVNKLRESDPKWPSEGTVEYEWRPDLEENPNSQRARELVDEADALNLPHADAVEMLLTAQVYATLAVRDQLAGFGCDFGGLPVRPFGPRD